MDPITAVAVLRLILQYAPDVVSKLQCLFPGDSQAAIDAILGMKTAEEIQAMVLAGQLDKTWTACKGWLDGEKAAAKIVYTLICVQKLAKPGSIPADEVKAADAANLEVGAAYLAALDEMTKGNVPAYESAATRLSDALATLTRIKVQYCPFLAKGAAKKPAKKPAAKPT